MCFVREQLVRLTRAPLLVVLLGASTVLWANPPTEAQVREAVRELRNDPQLNGDLSHQTLVWDSDRDEKKQPQPRRAEWLKDFIRWLERSMRLLVWVIAAASVIWLLWRLRRYLDVARPALTKAGDNPSHVQALDIRPESLPEDIGAQALILWRAGQQLAALSLLYRGALSRLVHHHGVAIRAASTEGDCVKLASSVLPETPSRYFADLVDCWRQAVYAGHEASEDEVTRLCHEFEILNLPPPAIRSV